ncbi:MAG: hypothetical protein EX271_01725 [Acidimicrobiales bacterium]|nr:MAG: hypothetical protein EX271_01725 [Acidimicrobiales bacterium]
MSDDYKDEFIQIVSDKFPKQPGEDDEIINEGMYGQALCLYLEAEMAKLGYEAAGCAEDWGWWVGINKDNFKSGLGIYCTSEPPALKTYAVCVLEQGFSKWSWTKFRKVSRKDEILKLRADLLSVFENDPEITVKRISDDPWE